MDVNILKYKVWADQRIINFIEKIDVVEFPDPYAFILQQLNHMVIVEALFKARLCSLPAPHAKTNSDVVPNFDTLKKRLTASGNWYVNFLLTHKNISENVNFTFVDGQTGKMSVEEILFHVVNHGSYHRGNIAHALDLAGIPHPLDGYCAFIHELEPNRRYVESNSSRLF